MNTAWGDQMLLADSYEEAVAFAEKQSGGRKPGKRVLGLHPGAVLFRRETLEKVGAMEERTRGSDAAVQDYCLRILEAGLDLRICATAVLWDMTQNRAYASYADRGETVVRDRAVLEEKWDMHYFNQLPNENLVNLIREEADSAFCVLEIGCDCGATLLEIQNSFPGASVYGCELREGAARIASHVASVVTANIEEQKLPWPDHSFDYILFGDVLEHLHDPAGALCYCRRLLKEEGRILACVPNLMHISVMEQLLRGDFTYTETGLLDRTHIHFFTQRELLRMFHTCGYETEEIHGLVAPLTQRQEQLIERLTELGQGEGEERQMYRVFQYLLRARCLPEKTP